MDIKQLKFPIGKFEMPSTITKNMIVKWIGEISVFPKNLFIEVKDLTDDQLDTPYRPGGWTIRQVIHHCADSHMNAFMRLKLALTEDQPTIKPYDEKSWAELPDSKDLPVQPSLNMLEGIHKRWTMLLGHLTDVQLEKTFIHPESRKTFRVVENIGLYAWHGNHHLAHITETKKRNLWT